MRIEVRNLSKCYNGKQILTDENMIFESGGIYCLMGPSGQGKTTFLRILTGLEKPDQGAIIYENGLRFGGVFQEDRLCESVNAITNVAMVLRQEDARQLAREQLEVILPADSLDKPVSKLSGGMKRRVAIVRAMTAPSGFIFMDEPFTGLDAQTKKDVIHYILRALKGRTLLVVTHQQEDADILGGRVITL